MLVLLYSELSLQQSLLLRLVVPELLLQLALMQPKQLLLLLLLQLLQESLPRPLFRPRFNFPNYGGRDEPLRNLRVQDAWAMGLLGARNA